MRLFISDTFYEAVIALPKAIQNKVVEFQKKFRENPTTNGMHVERIAQFKDDALRTARINDNYRAIIGVLGNDNYCLVYVGTHEDAYNWGKRKRFIWNDHTQSCQLVNVLEVDDVVNNPMSAPTDESFFKEVTDEQLLAIGVPENCLEKVRAIQTLDDLDLLDEVLPNDAYENIFNVMDGETIENIIRDIEQGLAKKDEDELLSDNNKRRFVELTDDDDLQRIIDMDMEVWQLFLHPSQRKLVNADYNGTMKVSGGAGTGKTVAALHRLKHLTACAETNVLFTTYTHTLKENLESLVKKMEINSSRFVLNNIDKVLMDCAKEHKIKEGFKVLDYSGDEQSLKLWREVLETEVTAFDEKFLYDEYIDVIVYYGIKDAQSYMMQPRVGRTKALSRKQRMEVWKLTEKYVALKQKRKLVDRLELFNETTNYLNDKNIRPYSHVIADEFQDFSNPELKFLRALVAEGRNDLFLTGDPMQRIYSGRKINFSAAGINVRGRGRSHRLKINYRTTEPIKRVAVSIIKGQEYDDMDGGKESTEGYVSLIHSGEKPKYVIVPDAKEEVKQVMKWIENCQQRGISMKDLCVAAPNWGLMKELQTRLHAEGAPYKELKGGTPKGAKDGISLCTFHSLKGLEFKAVILMGTNERNLPSRASSSFPFTGMDALDKKEFLSSKRSLLYVAVTRARGLAFMVGYGEPCEMLQHLIEP